MKKDKLYIKLLFVFSLIFIISGCETLDLDKSSDPFALTPEKASVDFLFNSIEEDFVRQIEGAADTNDKDNFGNAGGGLSIIGGQLTRMYASSSTNANNYAAIYQPASVTDEWRNLYAGILSNIRTMAPLAAKAGQVKHIGITQFIEAYSMTAMVDFFGDVPYSEINNGAGNFNPKVDSGASIYAAAIDLLDKAIVNFSSTTSSALNPKTEVFYNNDFNKWIKAANTLKMKLYLQTRLVDNTAITKFNQIVTSGNYISTSADDLVYNWGGTSASNPDNRHPRFGINYTSTGAQDYMSNWLMGTMNNVSDPRIRYYFYRQRSAVPGNGTTPPNEQDLSCSVQSTPAHYLAGGFTFCNLPNGYWGRDHGDNAGVPGDGFLRSTYGVYPAGGKFDGNNFANISPISGALGKGITPILLASWVDFMKAEVALFGNNAPLAKTEMLNGLSKSVAKVISFGPRDPNLAQSFVPTATNINNYSNSIGSSWDTADATGKWNILAVQSFIGFYGNGIESYNFYRRTGYPTSLQPNRSPNPGGFVRSLYYPSSSANNNSSISQKATQTVPVFWNTNSSPIAN